VVGGEVGGKVGGEVGGKVGGKVGGEVGGKVGSKVGGKVGVDYAWGDDIGRQKPDMLVPDFEAQQQGSKVGVETSAAQMIYLWGGDRCQFHKSHMC
jgi:hypothetical protein